MAWVMAGSGWVVPLRSVLLFTSLKDENVVIEWLKIQVDPDKRERYVQQDANVWTAALSNYPGFLGKEVWISPDKESEIIMVIRWASFEAWQAVPERELEQIEAQFDNAMGDANHAIVESSRFQVRKFMQPECV